MLCARVGVSWLYVAPASLFENFACSRLRSEKVLFRGVKSRGEAPSLKARMSGRGGGVRQFLSALEDGASTLSTPRGSGREKGAGRGGARGGPPEPARAGTTASSAITGAASPALAEVLEKSQEALKQAMLSMAQSQRLERQMTDLAKRVAALESQQQRTAAARLDLLEANIETASAEARAQVSTLAKSVKAVHLKLEALAASTIMTPQVAAQPPSVIAPNPMSSSIASRAGNSRPKPAAEPKLAAEARPPQDGKGGKKERTPWGVGVGAASERQPDADGAAGSGGSGGGGDKEKERAAERPDRGPRLKTPLGASRPAKTDAKPEARTVGVVPHGDPRGREIKAPHARLPGLAPAVSMQPARGDVLAASLSCFGSGRVQLSIRLL